MVLVSRSSHEVVQDARIVKLCGPVGSVLVLNKVRVHDQPGGIGLGTAGLLPDGLEREAIVTLIDTPLGFTGLKKRS